MSFKLLLLSSIISTFFNVFSVPVNEFIRAMGWANFELMRIDKDYCEDLTEKALNGELSEAVGREAELDRLIDILSRDGKGNVLLIGEPGVGKTQLAHGLAWCIANNKVPVDFKDKKIINADLVALIAGKNYDSSPFQPIQRIRALLKYAEKNKNVILFIDEFHQAVNSAEHFKTAIDRDKVRILAATTVEEYNRYIKPNEALDRRFEKIYVAEPSSDTVFLILKKLAKKIYNRENIVISDKNLNLIIEFCNEYIKEHNFPDKAIDVLNSAARLALRRKSDRAINENDIKKVISDRCGIPLDMFKNSSDDVEKLRFFLKSKVYGRDAAIDLLCNGLNFLKSGFKPKNSVISYLFLGGNAVGKKYLATLFGERIGSLIELDMSLYWKKNSIDAFLENKLNKNNFFRQISQNPFSVVHLTNIEKASTEMISLINDSLKNGYIIDNNGRKFDISNAIFIASKNVGDELFDSNVVHDRGDCNDSEKRKALSEFSKIVSNTIIFNKLCRDDFKNIANSMIQEFAEKLSKNNIEFDFDNDILEFLTTECENYTCGARDLQKRVIRDTIVPTIDILPKHGTFTSKIKIHCRLEDNKILVGCGSD